MGIAGIDSPRIKMFVILVSFVLIVISPFVSDIHRNIEPGIIAIDDSPIGGSVGYTINKAPVSPQRELLVYKGNVNDSNAGWSVLYGHDYRIHSDTDGVVLELGLTGETTGSPPGFYMGFHGTPTLPLMNYSEICFIVKTKVLEGAANVSLEVYYWAWPDNDWIEAGENSTHLNQDQTESLIFRPALEDAFNFTSEWIIRTPMSIEIVSMGYSRILIESVAVSVRSYEDLYPVTIDVQAPDGESLFLNPYTNLIGTPLCGSHRYGTKFLVVRLTRTGNASDSTPLGLRRVNETFYLSEGEYSGTAGWAGYAGYILESSSVGNLSFNVGPNEATQLSIRIPTFRLYIDIHPLFAYSRVSILTGCYDYVIDYPLKDVEYLYMSYTTSFGVDIRPLFYEASLGVDYTHLHSRQPRAVIEVQTNGISNVQVTVMFSQFSLFGLVIDFGQILGFLGGAILVLLLIYQARKKSFAGFLRSYKVRTNLLPVLFYYLSIFFPWVTYSFTTHAVPPTDVEGAVVVPLLFSFWWSADSQLTSAPSSYLLPNITLMLFVYWAPIFYISYLIATRQGTISYELFERKLEDISGPALVSSGPFIVGCYYLMLCVSGQCFPNIGLIIVLLTLPSWYVSYWMRKRGERSPK